MALRETLLQTPPMLFAAIDGALVEDLPTHLDRAGLSYRPLYRGELEHVGIHLVTVDTAEALSNVLEILGPQVPAVFWSWPASPEALFRHLRTLGKVEVPKDGTNPDDPEHETLLFRHADPASLMAVLEVLTADQRETFFGEARGLIFQKRDFRGEAGVVRVPRDGRILRGAVTVAPWTQ